jgi:MYXO-CTERM domain-containing protein
MSSPVPVSSAMRRIAALFTFVLLAGGSTPALADITPEPPPKSDDDDGCSVSNEDGGILGLAAIALLVSGMRLRRSSR